MIWDNEFEILFHTSLNFSEENTQISQILFSFNFLHNLIKSQANSNGFILLGYLQKLTIRRIYNNQVFLKKAALNDYMQILIIFIILAVSCIFASNCTPEASFNVNKAFSKRFIMLQTKI